MKHQPTIPCHSTSYTKDETLTSTECKCTVCECGNPYLDPLSEEFAEKLTEAFQDAVYEATHKDIKDGKPIC